MAEFLLQERRDEVRDIWVPPRAYQHIEPHTSDSVDELRMAIIDYADRQTLDFWQHFRIVTQDGKAVERWKTRPGEAKKTRRRS